jgi:ABC-2 type transport system ATP-binding protein
MPETLRVPALRGVSFAVEEGECVGYLGPNGAGKSTTIKVLTGILHPSSGRVVVDDLVPWRQRIRHVGHIGVVFGQRSQLYWDLPLSDTFELLRHVYGVPQATFRTNLERFATILELDELMDVPVRQLSLGQRMRGDLAAAMLHEPKLLFLDEPTIGLDIFAKARILDAIAQINREQGVTVLLTTHNLAEVERLCRRIILIDEGRIVHDGELSAFKQAHTPRRTLSVLLSREVSVRELAGLDITADGERRLKVTFPRDGVTPQQVIGQVAAAYPVEDLSLSETSLEEVLQEIYGDRNKADPEKGGPQ